MSALVSPARKPRRDPLLLAALALVGVQVLIALAAPVLAPWDPLHQDIVSRMKGPSAAHWFGADHLGRDVFARVLYGYRASLAVSTAAVSAALLVGGAIGLVAAYYRGWTERVLMRVMDVVFAFPVMLLAIGIIAVLGAGSGPAAAAIAIVYVPIFARLTRGPALVIAASEYVEGARAAGATDLRILFIHILPNLVSVLLVQASLLLSSAILVEASLSFLGVGVQPPWPSLGLMLSEGRNFLLLSPWSAIFSGLAILFLAFGFNLLGDTLRDRLDPRLRGGA